MKILLAAKHPYGGKLKIGGVQSWQETVSDELSRRGNTVHFWGPEFGQVKEKYDLGIFANLKFTAGAVPFCKSVKFISHGIISDERGGNGWFFTSEEVRGKFKGEILRQPIDLSFWSSVDCEKKYLTQFSYRSELPWIDHLAEEFGLEPIRVFNSSKSDVRDILQRSKVVMATGRAAVEAMACGCCVVIADNRPYQGPLLDFDVVGSMTRNYSGRGGVDITVDRMRVAIAESLGRGQMIDHVRRHHDVKDIADQLCSK